jgi:hypothetical protein
MPAPLPVDLPLPLTQLINTAPDIHGWVVVLSTAPNLEVLPPNELDVSDLMECTLFVLG